MNGYEVYKSKQYTIASNILKLDNATLNNDFYDDYEEVIKYYEIYQKGCDFIAEGHDNKYIPSDVNFKKIANLINKEARFMFAKTPEIRISALNLTDKNMIDDITTFQNLIDNVLKTNGFSKNIIKAAKDCFIGKRIAVVANFNNISGITINFVPALNFIYEVDMENKNILSTFIMYSEAPDETIFRKKYKLLDNGLCHIQETIYSKLGKIISEEEITTDLPFIPVQIIINDSLLNDNFGQSEVELLKEYEQIYSKLANADVDAERKSMNPVRYTVDADSNSTKNLSSAAGAYWDIKSDTESVVENVTASVGILEASMGYSSALKETLQRINTTMHDSVDMPDISLESMQGIITSGKALKSIYWPLIVRCDEKMMAWKPALEFIISAIIEGAKIYPEAAKLHIVDDIPQIDDYKVIVENLYPLPEEETEEKTMDIMEVNAQLMSRKAYMKKWRNLTDEQIEEELKQIALERQTIESVYFNVNEEVM